MKWYHYLACFFAGAFLANALPHFFQGISGNAFPTPFSDPPGKGLSSPIVNVLWGMLNFAVGGLLFKVGKVTTNKWALLLFFVAAAIMSLMLASNFAEKAHA